MASLEYSSIDLAENFELKLNGMVLCAVHEAINTLFCDCERHQAYFDTRDTFDNLIAKLKETVCKFTDGQAEAYRGLFS